MDYDSVARQLLDTAREMVPGRFEAVPATPSTHPRAHWALYDEARRTLEAAGFRMLGDVDVLSYPHVAAAAHRTPIRFMVSADGRVTAAFYAVALRWTLWGLFARLRGIRGGFLDLVTDWDDGVVLETTTAESTSVWLQPDFVRRDTLPKSTPIPDAVARHLARVRAYAAAFPQASPSLTRSLDDVVASAGRTEVRKLEFRRSIGWITRDELNRLNGGSGRNLDPVEAAIRRIAAEPEWAGAAQGSASA